VKDKKLVIMLTFVILLAISNVAFYSYMRINNLKEINKEENKDYKEAENVKETNQEITDFNKTVAMYNEDNELSTNSEEEIAIKDESLEKKNKVVSVKKDNELLSKLNKTTKLEELVRTIHKRLNEDVCYERTPSDEEYMMLASCFAVFQNRATNIKDNDNLKEDINDLALYLKEGGENKDKDKIILAHRMAHDLDYHYFYSVANVDSFSLARSIKVKR